MSSETDHPRQRTVAELLAAHGGNGNVSGRRRRRREPDEPDDGAYGVPATDPPEWRAAPPREPERRAPGAGLPPAPQEPAARRRGSDEPPWASNQWGADNLASDQWEADEWGADQWDDSDPWDAGRADSHPWDPGRREAASRAAAEPAHPTWGSESWAGGSRTPRHPVPEPVEPPEAPRRARRREPDDWEAAESWDPRSRSPEPLADEPPEGRGARGREPHPWGAPEPVARAVPEAAGAPAPGDAMRDHPTEQMPRVHAAPAADPASTTRMQSLRRRAQPDPEIAEPELDDDGGPATMIGAAPAGAEAWHRARTEGRRRRPEPGGPEPESDDGGPATMVGGAPAGAEAWHRARVADSRRDPEYGPPTQAASPMQFDDGDEDDGSAPVHDHPAGLGGPVDHEATSVLRSTPEAAVATGAPRRGTAAGRGATGQPDADPDEATAAPAWPVVIAQWIGGAIGGAALWVGFRFLWRDLPVVALAAAVLVTVGLVVLVRALLRSNDLRTTLFAVLVGLLLTVSPAILVLLGR